MNRIAPPIGIGGRGGQDEFKTLRPGDSKRASTQREQQEIIARAVKRLNNCVQAEAENRKAALEDRKFKQGDQWPPDVAAQRNFDKRPCMTINKMPTFVHQITNEQRQNRPAININPVGDKGDPEAAKMYRGMIRQIERACAADIAYDTAFDDAVSSGWGYWRVSIEYDNPKSFNKVLAVKQIRNPFTVYLDPMHQDPTGADSRYGFITELIPRDEFKEDYPTAQQMPWTEAGIGENQRQWIQQDAVRVAEYYELKTEKRALVMLENGHVGWKDELAPTAARMIVHEREADCPKLHWYKLTAVEILDERDLPGQWIPIIKCSGGLIDVEGKPYLYGIIRFAKDPQREYNYSSTMMMEHVALAPKAPWLAAEGQTEGYESMWDSANTKSYSTLYYRPVSLNGSPVPPPQRNAPVQAPQGWEVLKQGAAQDMMATTGIRFDSTLQERMYDESGRALREMRQRGDLGSFHYIDNLARALKHTGEIMIDLIPKVYDTKQVITILREDDSEERVQLDPNASGAIGEGQDSQGKQLKIFNPTTGQYGVTATIGPSYATKRIEASESMMDFGRAIGPQAVMLIADVIAKNQDWPGADEISTRLAKALPPNLITPEMKGVPPQVQAMIGSMQQQLQGLTQEKAQLMQALTDQTQDRALRKEGQDQNFEAKLLAIVQKAEASKDKAEAENIRTLAQAALTLKQVFEEPEPAKEPANAD